MRAARCAIALHGPSLLLALALLLTSAPAALAQAAGGERRGEDTPLNLPERSLDEAADGGGGLARTIVGLLVVIAVIYGITWVLKQLKRSQSEDASGTGLSDLAALPLGAGRSVHVVRAGDDVLLLGVTDGGVSLLRTYTQEEADEAGLLPPDDDEFRELGAAAPRGPATVGSVAADVLDRIRRATVRR